MFGRQLAGIIVTVGGGIIGISLLADVIGLGNQRGFGVKQLLGALIGVVIVSLGLLVMKKAP
jgi:hypothetical protein